MRTFNRQPTNDVVRQACWTEDVLQDHSRSPRECSHRRPAEAVASLGVDRGEYHAIQSHLESRQQDQARLAHAPNAVQALAMIEMHQAAGEVVRSIRSDQEGEIGLEMLRVLAQEELEELAG